MIENKNTDVELDTDGIEEQSIQVENKKQENEDNAEPREEVDLGYTEPKKPGLEGITVEEIKEDTKPKSQKTMRMIFLLFRIKLKKELIN
jgi:hypothetical protein